MRATMRRVGMSMWTWGVILACTGLYVVYVYLVGEAKPVQAQKGDVSAVQVASPDVVAQKRGEDAGKRQKADSAKKDVNIPKGNAGPAEDEQGWNCYSDGNGVCGYDAAPQYSYEDGSHTYAQPKHYRAEVTGDDVRMRSGPGGAVTGSLDAGFTFDAVCTSNGWVQGSNGNWVSGTYVETGGALPHC